MISLSGVGMRFGTQVLYEGVNWQLAPGAHYGLVGANGTGKSTLLRLMSGQLKSEGGTVSRPGELAIGTLDQDQFAYDERSLVEVVLGGRPRLWEALHEKNELLQQAGTDGRNDTVDGHRLAELESVIADQEGYQAESEAAALLAGLGLETERHERPMRELSGGYRLRVLLARTLFAKPGLLLLDEPTNHLDIISIRWLETYLRAFPGTFVLVSHDRHFLNAVCDQIADLDYQELRLYPGNYEDFVAAKELAVLQKNTEIARAEEKIAEMQRFIDRFKAKATKARQAQSRKKQVERMEIPEIKRSSRRYPTLSFAQKRPSGRDVLEVSGLAKSFGEKRVLHDVDFTLHRGERLGVVGPNGVGKSTLLNIIAGKLEPDSGVVRHGYEVQLGRFAQDHAEMLRGRASVYEWLHAESPAETVGVVRGVLGRMLFSGDEADKKVGDLSGGESARVLLAALMIKQDNLLVLDEPTNHLDLEGREALLRALQTYEGTVVFVSHDRHFIAGLADRVLVLSAQGAELYVGGYEDYLAAKGEDYLTAKGAAKRSPDNAAAAKRSADNAAAAKAHSDGNRRPDSNEARRNGAANGGSPGSAGPKNGAATPGATGGSMSSGGPAQPWQQNQRGRAAPPTLNQQQRKELKRETGRIRKRVQRLEGEVARIEGEVAEFEQNFAAAGYFEDTPWEAVQAQQQAQQEAKERLQAAMAGWEAAAAELDALSEGG